MLWWHRYNHEYAGGQLRNPVIRIGRASQELGQWSPQTRVLIISATHIEQHPWMSVLETLRHEMAHQYVYEVMGVTQQTPHGPAFAKACEQLRCSPRAQASSEELNANQEDEKNIRVLKKILALTDSPNEHEAQAAIQKARSLLIKYNVDMVNADQKRNFENRCLGKIKRRHTSYELWLSCILNSFFFVEVLWVDNYDPQLDQLGTVLQIYGTGYNLEMAEYVYYYLENLVAILWDQYKLSNHIRTNHERQRYMAGVLEGFYGKLRRQDKSLKKSKALIWKGDADLYQYYRYLNPSISTQIGGGTRRTQAYEDGIREGRQVTIRRPISESGAGTAGLLLQA